MGLFDIVGIGKEMAEIRAFGTPSPSAFVRNISYVMPVHNPMIHAMKSNYNPRAPVIQCMGMIKVMGYGNSVKTS
jgi:hypothetical protein